MSRPATLALLVSALLATLSVRADDPSAGARAKEVPPVPAPVVANPSPTPHQSWRLPAPPIETGPIVDPDRLHKATLPNGLRVLVLEDHRLPQVELGLAVRRGAANERPSEAGLASFLAELMERGAGDRDALALAQAVDRLGASFGVSAGWDSIQVDVSGLSRDLDPLFEVLSDLVLRPMLAPDEGERIRTQTLAALERAKDQPQTLASWHFARGVYGDHRFGLPLSGTPETVAGLDAEAARRFHASLFVPGNAILYASGDVEAADLVRRASTAFAGWVAKPVPEPGPLPPAAAPVARRIVVVDRPDLGQAQLWLGHEGIRREDPERIAVSLMNSTLGGGGFSSRLMTVIREREGLAYGVGSFYDLRRAPGPFAVTTATRVAEARRAVDLMLAELADMQERPPSADELVHAQTYAAGRFALGLETSGAVLASLVDLAIYDLPEDGLDTYRTRVAAVTLDDTARVARSHLHPDRAVIVAVGPAAELREALAELGPVEVVEP
jgi:zinc protease